MEKDRHSFDEFHQPSSQYAYVVLVANTPVFHTGIEGSNPFICSGYYFNGRMPL